jgi:RimJ/RimL family protein N-acetyltransferase
MVDRNAATDYDLAMQSNLYPAQYITVVQLQDGEQVTLRPIHREDAPALQEGFTHLSPETVYMRLLYRLTTITDETAQELTSVDYHERMAMVAAIVSEHQEKLVGLAQYSLLDHSTQSLAEVGVIVRDDYQGRGIGLLLMQHLARYASDHGIETLVGTVHLANQRVLRFIEKSGLPFTKKLGDGGVWEIQINISGIR